jgi:steroid delta-isomerase-like uncharacterized protein
MTTTNEQSARRFFEDMIANANWASAPDLMSEDVVMHHPSSPEPVSGRDAVAGFLGAFRAGFPDMSMVAEDTVAAGDKVAVRWRMRGTHTAELFGIPPTGAQVDVAGISWLRFSEGRVVEDWVAEDSLGLMRQLGVIKM